MDIQVNERGFIYDASPNQYWLPPINPKQWEVFQDRHRYLLVHGPRKSSKTWGIIHKTIRHAFDVNGAMVAIVAKTLKNAKSAGVWRLMERFLKIWEANCPGFKITEGPKVTGDSKMSFVRIRNRWGTVSEIQCHSLETSKEVEAKFKGAAYSMVWLSEVDQYCDEDAFDIFCDTLRMTPDIPYEDHQLICDCNPPDTGTENWMHDKWFKFKSAPPDLDEDDSIKLLRDSLHEILVMIEDNPQLDPRERKEMEARYRKRKALYNRFILGKWEQDIIDGHFTDVWDETIHIIGVSEPNSEPEIIVPSNFCTQLLCGWDMGEKNHSFHIVEKLMNDVVYTDPDTKREIRKSLVSFAVLDELVVIKRIIKRAMSIREFVEKATNKMEFWEKYVNERSNFTIRWRHWSDSDAFEIQAAAEKSNAIIAFEASGEKVILEKAPKYSRSNHDKKNFMWQLLYDQRLHISAQLHRTKLMFTNVRPGATASEYIKNDEHKHPFDSLGYVILAEAPPDMLRSMDKARAKTYGGIISVSI